MDYLCYRFSELPITEMDFSILSAEEQLFTFKRKQARLLLRQEIARRTHQAPADIRFSTNEHGKPYTEGIHFNISHSQDLLCLAFHHSDIGVDIQHKCEKYNIDRLAPRMMSEEQLQRFNNSTERERDFYYCWSIAEALVKLHGSTIWHAKDYPFILHGTSVSLSFENEIEVQLFQPQQGYYGAIAYRLSTCHPLKTNI